MILERVSQSPIEMLWHDLKQAVHVGKTPNVAELKRFWKEKGPKFLFDSLAVIANS